MRIRVLAWLALTLLSVALWWLAAWGAHECLDTIDPTLVAATARLVRDHAMPGWIVPGIDLLLDIAQAIVTSLWILGTLALLVGMAWSWRRGWRLPRFS